MMSRLRSTEGTVVSAHRRGALVHARAKDSRISSEHKILDHFRLPLVPRLGDLALRSEPYNDDRQGLIYRTNPS